jgi:hypothetical protein
MNRIFLALHIASMAIVCCLAGFAWLCWYEEWQIGIAADVVTSNITTFAIAGTITGFVSMAKRKGESESILLAISTIVAFMLMILSFLGRYATIHA